MGALNGNRATISRTVISVVQLFAGLIARLKDNNNDQPVTHIWSTPSDIWEDELGRLRVWAANIGAHQTNQSSLDFRLRDASHIRLRIVDLLQDLCQTTKDAEEVAADCEGCDNSPFADTQSDGDEFEPELQQLHGSVVIIINCLFQMSMLVRKPAHHDLLTEKQPQEISVFEAFDRDHVRNKFPQAEESLVNRLALALTRRRKQLHYRERHRAKLGRGIDDAQPTAAQEQETSSLMSDTVATYFQPWDSTHTDEPANSETSETSYASTLFSGANISLPSPPRDAIGGSPFECPYCYFLITAKDSRTWYKHVFLDLKPYICTIVTCPTPYKLYSTQHEWVHHLRTMHTADWGGEQPANTTFVSMGSGLQEILATCPLCKANFASHNLLEQDLARHLQELALFVLPRSGDDSEDEESNGSGPNHFEDDSSKPSNHGPPSAAHSLALSSEPIKPPKAHLSARSQDSILAVEPPSYIGEDPINATTAPAPFESAALEDLNNSSFALSDNVDKAVSELTGPGGKREQSRAVLETMIMGADASNTIVDEQASDEDAETVEFCESALKSLDTKHEKLGSDGLEDHTLVDDSFLRGNDDNSLFAEELSAENGLPSEGESNHAVLSPSPGADRTRSTLPPQVSLQGGPLMTGSFKCHFVGCSAAPF